MGCRGRSLGTSSPRDGRPLERIHKGGRSMSPGLVNRKCLYSSVGLLTVLIAALPASRGQTPPVDPPKSQRVFVAGHSFHMPIARMLDQIARSAGVSGEKLAGLQGIGGSSVTKHWELSDDQD